MKNNLAISKNQFNSLAKPTTAELIMLLSNQNEMELVEYEKKMTLEKAIEGTSLKKLSKIIDSKNLIIALVFLINRLSSNFNVGKKFTNEQAIVMAIDMIDVFEYETIEDVLLMFKMVRTGRLGDGKDFKLDSQTIFHKWIPQYLEIKLEFRQREHTRNKELSFNNQLTLEQVRKTYNKITAQKREDNINKRIDEITKSFNREMLENLIDEWKRDETKKKFLRYLTKKRLTIKK